MPSDNLTSFKKGKVRDLYDLGDKLLIVSSNRISAFDVNSVTEISGKGRSLNALSAWWFRKTETIFPNHFLDVPEASRMLVKKAERIDVEWVMRGYLYGSMHREYAKGERELYGYTLPTGLSLAEKLPEVMLTPTTKADVGHDMPLTRKQAIDAGLLTQNEWKSLEEASFKLYDFYARIASERGIIIPDFKLEFGRYDKGLIQIDEAPTHDSARFWVKQHYQVGKRQEAWCLDKEFYRQFLIDSGIDPSNPPNPLPEIPRPCVIEIQKRLATSEVFAGNKNIDSLQLRSLEDVEKELAITKSSN
jgi:phosphoribosylaminoimidazole-succinocarboxamide synthase